MKILVQKLLIHMRLKIRLICIAMLKIIEELKFLDQLLELLWNGLYIMLHMKREKLQIQLVLMVLATIL